MNSMISEKGKIIPSVLFGTHSRYRSCQWWFRNFLPFSLLITSLLSSPLLWAGGVIEGRIIYRGNPPAPKQYGIARDLEVCGTSKWTKDFLVHKDHGIQNVVVSIEHLKGLKDSVFQHEVVTIRACEFWPYITLVSTEGSLTFINGDNLIHQFQAKALREPPKNPTYNLVLTSREPTKQVYLKIPEIIGVTSTLRPWMQGYLYVTDHPFTTLTDGTGTFVFQDVPEGRYHLKAWHEKLGFFSKRVIVKEGEKTEVKWIVGHDI